MPILDDDAFERTKRTVLRDELRYGDATKEGSLRYRPKRGCKNRNEQWTITVIGKPTGGTFDMSLNVLGTTDTLTFNFDDSNTDVQTEFETHTNIASGDVTVTGGDFPNVDIHVEFTGDLAQYAIPSPTINFASLTGGSGLGVLLARWTSGWPKDGSVAP